MKLKAGSVCVSVCVRVEDRTCQPTFDFLFHSFLHSASYFLSDASNTDDGWQLRVGGDRFGLQRLYST